MKIVNFIMKIYNRITKKMKKQELLIEDKSNNIEKKQKKEDFLNSIKIIDNKKRYYYTDGYGIEETKAIL